MPLTTLIGTSAIASAAPPSGWDGSEIDETLTVTVTEVMRGGARFSPLPVEWRIRVSGSVVGDTPDTSVGTQSGPDGTRGTAPVSEAFMNNPDAFQTRDPTFTRIHYVVHTGDSGNYKNDWVGHASHRSRARQYTQNPGHVYSSPGTYENRSIYVYDDQGKWGTLALDPLEVVNPDDAFLIQNVIVFSNTPGEDWSGAPPHLPVNRFTNISDAMDRVYALRRRHDTTQGDPAAPTDGGAVDDGDGVRVTGRPGTYNEYANRPNFNNMKGPALIDTWGQTGKVVYDERGAPNLGRRDEFFSLKDSAGSCPLAVKGWDFIFGIDRQAGQPVDGWEKYGTGGVLSTIDGNWLARAASPGKDALIGQRHCFDDCIIKGCGNAVFGTLGPEYTERNAAIFLSDVEVSECMEYIVYQPSSLFVLGCKWFERYGDDQGMSTRNRGGGGQRHYKGHTGIRETSAWAIYIAATYQEAEGGWSGQPQTFYSPQPMNRFHNATGGAQRFGTRQAIVNSAMFGTFNLDLGADDATDWAGRHSLVECCLIVHDPAINCALGDPNDENSFVGGMGGNKAFRNNVCIVLNTKDMNQNSPEFAGKKLTDFEQNSGTIRVGAFNSFLQAYYQPPNFGQDMQVLNNTFAMLRTPANIAGGTYWDLFPNVYDRTTLSLEPLSNYYDDHIGNNVSYQPNMTPPVGPTMEKVDLPAGMRVLNTYIRKLWERQTHTLAGTVSVGQTTEPIAYPADFNNDPTTGADYTGSSGLHTVRLASSGDDYAQIAYTFGFAAEYMDSITVNHDLDASGNPASPAGTGTHFTVTLRSGPAWSGDITILLDRGSTAMEPLLLEDLTAANANDLKLYRPATPVAVTPGVRQTLFAFDRSIRPGTPFAISGSGTDYAGALLPA